jgi:hypothetical protein
MTLLHTLAGVAMTVCSHCARRVALVYDRGELRVGAHDLPAYAELAGACPRSGASLGRVASVTKELERGAT